MSDVEFLTEMNHRRARAKELGARWEELNEKKKQQKKAKKTGLMVLCVTGGWASAMGIAAFVLGRIDIAAIFAVISLAAIIGGNILYD